MPANYRVQVVLQLHTGEPERDYVTNSLHYGANTTLPPAIGDAVWNAFFMNINVYGQAINAWTKVYDMAAPAHSPPVYVKHATGAGTEVLGPRQVALCLSFYSGLNVRGQRGRIYVGPWAATDLLEMASATTLTKMIALAGALKNPGGADVIHQIWHHKTATWSNVSNYFVNNRWDTMRSRLQAETARQTLP